MISRHTVDGRYPVSKLGEAVEFLDNLRKPVTESERTTGAYPYFGANGLQGNINDFIFDESLVLLAEDGGHFGSPERGIAYRIHGKTWVNNHAHVLRPKSHIDLDFLCRVLENYDVTPFVTGTTRGKLTKAGASEIPIPVPPLPEQRRIAAILDQADALRAKRRKALAQLGSLTQSIFIEMFGDPILNTKKLPPRKLGEVTTFENGDRSSNYPSGDDLKDEGVLFLSTKNITDGVIDLSNKVFITESKFSSLSRGKVKRNDLIITLRGTLGSCCIFDGPYETGFINAQMMIIRPSNECHSSYLHAFLTSKKIQGHFARIGNGAAVPQLTSKQFSEIVVPMPSTLEQQKFALRKQSLDSLKAAHKQSISELDGLFASLQRRAFRGEL